MTFSPGWIRHRPLPVICAVLGTALVLLASAVAGCGSVIDRVTAPEAEESASGTLLAAALEYGGWTLPPSSRVLLVRKEIERDTRYRIAVEIGPGEMASMLERSQFGTVFTKQYPPFASTPIAGPELESSPNVQRAQDWFRSESGRVLLRDVLVDERSSATWMVHLDFRGV